MSVGAAFILFLVWASLMVANHEKIRRWWKKGCLACLIEMDLDTTSSSRSWAQAATAHTCYKRKSKLWMSRGIQEGGQD